jgi:hypothetical protein
MNAAEVAIQVQHDLRQRAVEHELAHELSDVDEPGAWSTLSPDERDRDLEMARVALRWTRAAPR